MAQSGSANGIIVGSTINGENINILCEKICIDPINAQNICLATGNENCSDTSIANNICQETCQENPYTNYRNIHTKTKNTTYLSKDTIGYIIGLIAVIIIFLFIIIIIQYQWF